MKQAMDPRRERQMRRQTRIGPVAVIATAVFLPVLLSVLRRTRSRDYTRSSEFRAYVGDFVI
jgi:hypothetical protein